MSHDTTPPALTVPLSEALADALTRWTHPTYDDQEEDQ